MAKSVRDIVCQWKAEGHVPISESTVIHVGNGKLTIITAYIDQFVGKDRCLIDKYRNILRENDHDLEIYFIGQSYSVIEIYSDRLPNVNLERNNSK